MKANIVVREVDHKSEAESAGVLRSFMQKWLDNIRHTPNLSGWYPMSVSDVKLVEDPKNGEHVLDITFVLPDPIPRFEFTIIIDKDGKVDVPSTGTQDE